MGCRRGRGSCCRVLDAGSSDACGVATVSIDVDSFSCASVDASPNAVELSVVDNHGNVATDTYYVTVVDETAPAFVITPTTLELDAAGSYSFTHTDHTSVPTD